MNVKSYDFERPSIYWFLPWLWTLARPKPMPGFGRGGAKPSGFGARAPTPTTLRIHPPPAWGGSGVQKPSFRSMLSANYASPGCKNQAFARCCLQILPLSGAKTKLSLDAVCKLCSPGVQKPSFRSMLSANPASQGCQNQAFARCCLQIMLPRGAKTML